MRLNRMYKKYYFNFEKKNNYYLLTNEFGFNSFLSKKNFELLINNKKLPNKIANELEVKKFIYTESDEDFLKFNYWKLKAYKKYLNDSTVLHIFVVSKNCNYSCVYCQAGNLSNNKDCLMDKDTAKKAVDIAFESKSKDITFEFQGGEPLIQWELIK